MLFDQRFRSISIHPVVHPSLGRPGLGDVPGIRGFCAGRFSRVFNRRSGTRSLGAANHSTKNNVGVVLDQTRRQHKNPPGSTGLELRRTQKNHLVGYSEAAAARRTFHRLMLQ